MHAKEVTPEQEPQAPPDRGPTLPPRRHAEAPRRRRGNGHPQRLRDRSQPEPRRDLRDPGLMSRLNDEELEAVLAHELSHVAHRDVAIMTIASGVGMLAGLVSRIALWSTMLGGGGRGTNGQQLVFLELATFARLDRHLRHRLLVDDGALALPRTRRGPIGRDPHRQAERARQCARAHHRRHGRRSRARTCARPRG